MFWPMRRILMVGPGQQMTRSSSRRRRLRSCGRFRPPEVRRKQSPRWIAANGKRRIAGRASCRARGRCSSVLGTAESGWDDSEIVVQSLETGERRALPVRWCQRPHAPTRHLVYVRAGTLYAVGFDPTRLEVSGDPVPVVEVDADIREQPGGAPVSPTRALWFTHPLGRRRSTQACLVDRAGTSQSLTAPVRSYAMPRISPTADESPFSWKGLRTTCGYADVNRNTLTRLTLEGTSAQPIWSPRTAKTVAFAAQRLESSRPISERRGWQRHRGATLDGRICHPSLMVSRWKADRIPSNQPVHGSRLPGCFRSTASESHCPPLAHRTMNVWRCSRPTGSG